MLEFAVKVRPSRHRAPCPLCCKVNGKCQQQAHHRRIHCWLIFSELSARLDDKFYLGLWCKKECRSTRLDGVACVDLLHRCWLWYWLIRWQLVSLTPLISAIVLAKDSEFLHRLIHHLRLEINNMMMCMQLAAKTHHASRIEACCYLYCVYAIIHCHLILVCILLPPLRQQLLRVSLL